MTTSTHKKVGGAMPVRATLFYIVFLKDHGDDRCILDATKQLWTAPKDAKPRDVALFYVAKPRSCISAIGRPPLWLRQGCQATGRPARKDFLRATQTLNSCHSRLLWRESEQDSRRGLGGITYVVSASTLYRRTTSSPWPKSSRTTIPRLGLFSRPGFLPKCPCRRLMSTPLNVNSSLHAADFVLRTFCIVTLPKPRSFMAASVTCRLIKNDSHNMCE